MMAFAYDPISSKLFHEEGKRFPHNYKCSKIFAEIFKHCCFSSEAAEAYTTLSSEGESSGSAAAADIDDTHVVVLLTIQALRARAKNKAAFLGDHSLYWVISPAPGELLIAPEADNKQKKYEKGDINNNAKNNKGYENDDDDDTETFVSVKSCFTCCSSENGTTDAKEFGRKEILEDLGYLQGWPFGLWRKAIVLPPLPSSPSESWIWRKKRSFSCYTK